MTRIVILLVALALGSISQTNAQSKYEQGMKKALELWGAQKPFESSNMFERITEVESEEWLPHYYIAMINALYSFGVTDKEKLTLQLERAKKHIEEAELISPNNPEILIIKATINTAWIAYDGATYGMTLSMKNAELYKKAFELAPENPRVVLSKAEWDMGSAKYFGQSTEPYCKDVERSLELFATFKAESTMHPSWGKDRAEEVLKSCK
ncbi:hypothetical protein [Spongiivirga citrea]|uniref:Tetratricopeptide repeat protein n=1 Tax=Spongiivirga citrea TaxID=1481457 RepID=A0A6M0CPB6_9FLAO|nr:hypothetical protein [Spongiivirga citrea]NER17709.1 hypothetical protein [Spongiivirga citrea]